MTLTHLLFLSWVCLSATALAFDITNILGQHPELSTFNNYLTQTQLTHDINSRKSITLLAIANSDMGPLSGKPMDQIKKIMAAHVLLGYYDLARLKKIQGSTLTVPTLLHSNSINIIVASGGVVAFGFTRAQLVRTVESDPYTISILQINSPIVPCSGLPAPRRSRRALAESPAQSPSQNDEHKQAPSQNNDHNQAPSQNDDQKQAPSQNDDHKQASPPPPPSDSHSNNSDSNNSAPSPQQHHDNSPPPSNSDDNNSSDDSNNSSPPSDDNNNSSPPSDDNNNSSPPPSSSSPPPPSDDSSSPPPQDDNADSPNSDDDNKNKDSPTSSTPSSGPTIDSPSHAPGEDSTAEDGEKRRKNSAGGISPSSAGWIGAIIVSVILGKMV